MAIAYAKWLLAISYGYRLWPLVICFLAIDIYAMFIMAMVIINGYWLFPMAIDYWLFPMAMGYWLFSILEFRFWSFQNFFKVYVLTC